MKEEIFSKFRDYNSELEKILEKKDFSQDAKNLLLSMFYKLESSYEDYQTVKRNVKSKQEYLENILDNIKQCNKIETLKSADPEFAEWAVENKTFDVDMKLKKIRVVENEISLLSALLELDDFKIYLEEKYNLIRNSFPYLVNTANDMNHTEVLRDFNAFSWNIVVKDIPNIPINLVYHALQTALTVDLIKQLEHTNSNQDIIRIIKDNMKTLYDEKTAKKFMMLVFKLSILLYIQTSPAECKRLQDEFKNIAQDLDFITNKKEYIAYTTKRKQEYTKQIKEIDLMINDQQRLIQEYERRNAELSEYHKIFSLSHLTERLQKEKARAMKRIEEYSKRLEPRKYVENKQKLQDNYSLLKGIDFENIENNQKLIDKLMMELQLLLLSKLLPQKIEKLDEKEDLINFMYELRYYAFIMYNAEQHIKEMPKLQQPLQLAIETLLKKMYQQKTINVLSTNEKCDLQCESTIFYYSIINLEDIYMELVRMDKSKGEYELTIFDGKDTIAETVQLTLAFHKRDKVKLKKKIKLF